MASIPIISLNVRGLNNEQKRRNLFSWLNDINVKIAFLQETFCKKEFNPSFDNYGWAGRIIHNFSNSSHSRGVAILIHDSINYEIHNVYKKEDARAILVNTTIAGK